MANIMRRGERGQQGMQRGYGRDPFQALLEMMSWDPFTEMQPMRGRAEGGMFVPQFDVKEREDAYVFKADLPGIREEDLDVSLTGNRLTVSGSRQQEEAREGERWHSTECSYGSFLRTFTLPEGIDGDHVEANLENGVLMITIPKMPEVQPKKIQLGKGGKRVGDGGQQAQGQQKRVDKH